MFDGKLGENSVFSSLSSHTETKRKNHETTTLRLEGHLKGKVDGYFSKCNQLRTQAATERALHTIEDVIDVLSRDFDTRYAADPTIASESFIHYWPPPKAAFVTYGFAPNGHGPSNLKECHHWFFKLKDARRKSLWIRGSSILKLTGVQAVARYVWGVDAPMKDRFVPVLQLMTNNIMEDPVDNQQNDERFASEPNLSTKMHNGWRIYYKSECPELANFEALRPRLKAKLRTVEAGQMQEVASRRGPVAERFAFQQATALKAARHAKRVAESLRLMRSEFDSAQTD